MALNNKERKARNCGCNAKWKGALELARALAINSVSASTPQGLYMELVRRGYTYDTQLAVWVKTDRT